MQIKVQKLMEPAALTKGNVELLTVESGRVMRMVLVESKKFAAEVAADMAEMNARPRASARQEQGSRLS